MTSFLLLVALCGWLLYLRARVVGRRAARRAKDIHRSAFRNGWREGRKAYEKDLKRTVAAGYRRKMETAKSERTGCMFSPGCAIHDPIRGGAS